jgi:hypothetical protein
METVDCNKIAGAIGEAALAKEVQRGRQPCAGEKQPKCEFGIVSEF